MTPARSARPAAPPPATISVDGLDVAVTVSGPDRSGNVVLLGAVPAARDAYGAICARLHNAGLRTVVIGTAGVPPDAVPAVLDAVGVRWAVLFGDRSGAELAWQLAATRFDRFTALVAVDRGHPRACGDDGAQGCGPVELDTTILVSTPAAAAAARASRRYVHGDFRQVDLLDRRRVTESAAQLAAEIVLRSADW